MKKIVFFLSILLLTMGSQHAQAANAMDGKEWKLLNRYIEGRTMRKVLLQGIQEGAQVMDTSRASEVYPSSDYEKLVSLVDTFYSDDSNLSIPVTHAYYIASMQLKNRPKSDIDEAIKKFKEGLRMQFMKTGGK